MSDQTIILITTDNHTLGIQTVAKTIQDQTSLSPVMYCLPSTFAEYPDKIERIILEHLMNRIDEAEGTVLIGFHLKELSYDKTKQLANKIKQYRGGKVKLVAGGTYATAVPSFHIDLFDYVVVGSGKGIIKVVDAIYGNKAINPIVMTVLDNFEYPSFADWWTLSDHGEISKSKLLPFSHPQYAKKTALEIMLSSGCSYSCSYCEVSMLRAMFGTNYKVSFAEVGKIIDLIKEQVSINPAINYVYLFDEDFLLKPVDHIVEFSTRYKSAINLPFFIFASPLSVLKFPDKILTLAKAGLDTINVGIQSGCEKISQNLFGRKESKEEVKDAAQYLVDLYRSGKIGSPPMVDFIILNPFEEVEYLTETIEFIKSLPTPFNAIMHCMSFFKGTPLYIRALSEGVIPGTYRFKYDLHDFMSRMKDNEFGLAYSKKRAVQWLFLNVLLYGMRGYHYLTDRERCLGNYSEDQLVNWLNIKDIEVDVVFDLAHQFSNPMENMLLPWEKPYANVLKHDIKHKVGLT
jgi:hypothetical protein